MVNWLVRQSTGLSACQDLVIMPLAGVKLRGGDVGTIERYHTAPPPAEGAWKEATLHPCCSRLWSPGPATGTGHCGAVSGGVCEVTFSPRTSRPSVRNRRTRSETASTSATCGDARSIDLKRCATSDFGGRSAVCEYRGPRSVCVIGESRTQGMTAALRGAAVLRQSCCRRVLM